ncbi:MAG: hypothetical protein AAFX44_03905 [Pseudomonadota bacterium]
MKKLVAAICLSVVGVAHADLEPWKDYDIGEQVTSVTTVKVDANMIDKYLEGLRATWVTGNETAKSLGQIEDYGIWVSELPQSGDFNVVLTVTLKDSSMLQPSKERYDAFMEAWGEENEKRTDEIVPTYPDIRKITGEYHLRRITMK